MPEGTKGRGDSTEMQMRRCVSCGCGSLLPSNKVQVTTSFRFKGPKAPEHLANELLPNW